MSLRISADIATYPASPYRGKLLVIEPHRIRVRG
jgi:hypothetical protein